MSLVTELQSLPSAQWRTGKAVIFDWYDGPREGVCALVQPKVEFAFELLEERTNPDDLDDRLFRLKELPPGSVERISSQLAQLGPPDQPVWVPSWEFATKSQQLEVEQRIDEILSRATAAPVVIFTRDMTHFLGCWQVDIHANGAQNWFTIIENAGKGKQLAR